MRGKSQFEFFGIFIIIFQSLWRALLKKIIKFGKKKGGLYNYFSSILANSVLLGGNPLSQLGKLIVDIDFLKYAESALLFHFNIFFEEKTHEIQEYNSISRKNIILSPPLN